MRIKSKETDKKFHNQEEIHFLKCHKQNYPINCILLYHYGIFDIWEYKKRKIDEKLMTDNKMMNWKRMKLLSSV